MNKVGICDKCRAVNYKSIIEKIKQIDPNVEINVGCQNMCGIGRNKPFVILNHKPIIGNDEKEVIAKITALLIN